MLIIIKVYLFISQNNNYISSNERSFFSWSKGIGGTFNIEDQGNTSKNPFLSWQFGLELGSENICVSSIFCLVDWALINSWVYLESVLKLSSSAINNWYNRELLLWSRFFKLSNTSIPSSAFNLETKDVGTLFAWWQVLFPIEFFKNISLDSKFVKLLFFFSRIDLLNGCQERLWVEKSIQECAFWSCYWIIFPHVQLIKSLLEII